VIERLTEVHSAVGCQPPYKVQRRRKSLEERLLETHFYLFICELIVGVEDLVHFR
jgi:hypothetical protein